MIRVLFVTETPAAVRPFERHLNCFGCAYELASSGGEALDRLEAAQYDGVVVATQARASGAAVGEVVRAVRAAHPGQIVVALAPEEGGESRSDLLETGANTVLPLSCTPSQFVAGLMAAILPN